jgi:hypothetical protein
MRIEQGARIIVENWIHAQPDDVIHFITDETKLREAAAFTHATRQIGAIPKLTVLPSDSVQAGDSIEEMRNIMSYATAIVGATNYSFITTNAVDYALHHGARFLSLPLSTNDGSSLLEQDFLKMDPAVAARMGRPMLRCLRSSDTVHITTKLGTDIHFNIKNREPGIFNGVTARAGVCASASFEVYIPPVETKTHGRVILDGSMGYIGLVKKPLELGFENGYLTYIEPTEDGKRLRDFMEEFGDPEMYCAAELGIGLNQLSKCRGASYIEDESTYGTFHIGFGRNLALGGDHNAAGHFDIVVHNPTIITGESVLMKHGESCAWF